jgi:hypothetical protein
VVAIVKAGATGGVAVMDERTRGREDERTRETIREAYNYAVESTFVMSAVAEGWLFFVHWV